MLREPKGALRLVGRLDIMYLLITQERIEISQKFQQIWIQQAKTIFPM
jgi:hypothetical protein